MINCPVLTVLDRELYGTVSLLSGMSIHNAKKTNVIANRSLPNEVPISQSNGGIVENHVIRVITKTQSIEVSERM